MWSEPAGVSGAVARELRHVEVLDQELRRRLVDRDEPPRERAEPGRPVEHQGRRGRVEDAGRRGRTRVVPGRDEAARGLERVHVGVGGRVGAGHGAPLERAEEQIPGAVAREEPRSPVARRGVRRERRHREDHRLAQDLGEARREGGELVGRPAELGPAAPLVPPRLADQDARRRAVEGRRERRGAAGGEELGTEARRRRRQERRGGAGLVASGAPRGAATRREGRREALRPQVRQGPRRRVVPGRRVGRERARGAPRDQGPAAPELGDERHVGRRAGGDQSRGVVVGLGLLHDDVGPVAAQGQHVARPLLLLVAAADGDVGVAGRRRGVEAQTVVVELEALLFSVERRVEALRDAAGEDGQRLLVVEQEAPRRVPRGMDDAEAHLDGLRGAGVELGLDLGPELRGLQGLLRRERGRLGVVVVFRNGCRLLWGCLIDDHRVRRAFKSSL